MLCINAYHQYSHKKLRQLPMLKLDKSIQYLKTKQSFTPLKICINPNGDD